MDTDAAPPEVRLTRLSGPQRGSVLVFRRTVIRVGAFSDNDVTFEGEEGPHLAPVHAKIVFAAGKFALYDNEDEFGTYVNGGRIDAVELKTGDEIRLGDGGPILRFAVSAPAPSSGGETVVRPLGTVLQPVADFQRDFRSMAVRAAREFALDRPVVRIGRDAANDLVLNHPQVSAFHARLAESGGRHAVEDLRSRNGTYVNGSRVSAKLLAHEDSVHIGPFLLVYSAGRLLVYDESRRAEIEARNLTYRPAPGAPALLDDVTLRIGTGELVGILGPSGAGKSTLLGALCGLKPPSGGRVLLNDLDLYENYEYLKQHAGYVPQDDIVHRELSAERTFEYVARLRLPPDIPPEERGARIRRVLALLELQGRERLPVHRLSGGQRKRVSIGVELLTEPQFLFLDEPTAGLDPALETKMMVLFRELSRQGRTVVVTTHLMENVDLFDKLVVMVRGRLAFFGTPAEAREYFGIPDLRGLFARLGHRTPEEWSARQAAPAARTDRSDALARAVRRRVRLGGIGPAVRQLRILCRRNLEIVFQDRRNLAILLLQAPIIGLFVVLAMEHSASILFMLTLSAIWFGTSTAVKEIVKELPIYRRERMFNLGVVPYVFSKVLVLFGISLAQCALLLGTIRAFRPLEGDLVLLFGGVVLTAAAGLLLGLFVSALVGSTDKAASTVPLLLIPQVLFAGAFTPLTGGAGVVSLAMPSRWSFDLLKRGVMETHRAKEPPLVAIARKEEAERELLRLDRESRELLGRIDGHVERFSESHRRMEAHWVEMDAEIRRLEQHEGAIRGGYSRARLEFLVLEMRRREVEAAVARQRRAILEIEEEMKRIQRDAGDPARAGDILKRLTPEWLEKKRAALRDLIEMYEKLQTTAAEVRGSQERLARDVDMIGARMQDAARSGAVLRAGKGAMEQEGAAIRGAVEETVLLEKSLKERADRMRGLQDDLMTNLREGKFVFLDPADSLRKDALVLAAFCFLFLCAVCWLQKRRDRE